MTKLVQAFWSLLFGAALFAGLSGTANATVTILPSQNVGVVAAGNDVKVFVGPTLQPGDDITVQVTDLGPSDTVDVTFVVDWYQYPDGPTPALSLVSGTLTPALAVLNGPEQLASGSPFPGSGHWTATYQLTDIGNGTYTVSIVGDPAFISATGGIGASVPEPATMILLGTGLAGVAGARRRQRRKNQAAFAAK